MHQTSLNAKVCFWFSKVGIELQFGRASSFCFDFTMDVLVELDGSFEIDYIWPYWLQVTSLAVSLTRLIVSAGTAWGFALGISKQIGLQFPLNHLLHSFRHSKAVRSIIALLNYKNEASNCETFPDHPDVRIENKRCGNEKHQICC